MERRAWKSVLSFLLVLALTVAAISMLSTATAAKADTAPERYAAEVRATQSPEAAELSANVTEKKGFPFASIGAFMLILIVPAAAVSLLTRAEHREHSRYSPKADRTLQVRRTARSRV